MRWLARRRTFISVQHLRNQLSWRPAVLASLSVLATVLLTPAPARAQVSSRNILDAGYFLQLTAGNPEISFDTNDFFSYNRGSNTGVFWVNGTTQLSFNPTGVGVGTANPQQALHVNGDVQVEAGIGTTVGTGSFIDFKRSSDGWNPARIEQLFSGAGSQGTLVFLTNSGGGNSDLTEKMRLDHQGFLGIGTTPTQMLDVNGQVRIRGGSPGAGKVLTSDATGVATWQTPTGGSNTRIFWAPDTRSGCPPVAAAGSILISQSFTTSAATTPITVQVDNIAANTTRTDTFLWVNGVAVRNDLTDTASVSWQSIDIAWGGSVGPGTHTIQFTSSNANVVGCGSLWGGMTVSVYGPP